MAIEVKTEYIDQFLKKQYDEKGKVVTLRNKIWQRVAGCLPLDNLKVNRDPALKLEAIREMKESDGDHYYIAHLSGGDNGLADWVRYFTWLTMFVNEAKNGISGFLCGIDDSLHGLYLNNIIAVALIDIVF